MLSVKEWSTVKEPKLSFFFTNFRAYCAPKYFGGDCNTFCEPQDDLTDGHYTCDPTDGSKNCRPGWSGSKCLRKVVSL